MAWILALLLPLSAAAGWLLVQVFGNRLLRDIDVALEEEAATVAELLLRPSAPDAMAALLAQVAAETDVGTGKRIVVSRRGQVIGEAPPGAHAVPPDRDPTQRSAVYRAGPADDPLTVIVSVSAAQALHARQRLTLLLAIGIPCGLLVVAAGLWAVTGRTLRPLQDAARRLEALDVDRLAARMPVANPHDEVGHMVIALNRMLDRVAAAVGEMQRFTADAAHELRTPLAVLRTGLDVALARERSTADYRAALVEALEGTDRLACLAEDLLTLARLEAGADSRRCTPIDLAEVLQELADAWGTQATQQAVAVEVSVGAPVSVEGTPADLYRLLGNLIENAVRHSPRGGRIRLRAESADGWAQVIVTDQGPGLAADDQARVFERFYRGRGETGAGTGLGLSIAQAIARAHGGHVALANGDGGGCVATVSLPRAAKTARSA
jgi:signal transduction histidine kinase